MFTIDQIKQAHSKVKNGADFPKYIQDLKVLGVIRYDNYVTDGKTYYFGTDNDKVTSVPKYPSMEIAATGSTSQLKHALAIHQAGQTDYLTFCKQAASAGVERWTVDLHKMTCVYFDRVGEVIISEEIPK